MTAFAPGAMGGAPMMGAGMKLDPILDPGAAQQLEQIQRNQQIAALLANQAFAPPEMNSGGRIAPRFTIGHGLEKLAAALMGKSINDQTDRALTGFQNQLAQQRMQMFGGGAEPNPTQAGGQAMGALANAGGQAGPTMQAAGMQNQIMNQPRPGALQIQGMSPEASMYLASTNPAAYGQILKDQLKSDYGTEAKFTQDGRAYVLDNKGNIKFLDGITPRDRIVNENGMLRSEFSPNYVGVGAQDPTKGIIYDNQGRPVINRLAQSYMTDQQRQQLGIEGFNAATGRMNANTNAYNSTKPVYDEKQGAWLQAPSVQNPNGVAIPMASPKSVVGARQGLELIPEIERLLHTATSSGVGNAYDATVGFFGSSTKGAQATGQLKIISSQLLMNVPRFEGPQSDRDTAIYREAAGNLADPSAPRETKLASLRALRDVLTRNANGGVVGLPAGMSPYTPSAQPTPMGALPNSVTGGVIDFRSLK